MAKKALSKAQLGAKKVVRKATPRAETAPKASATNQKNKTKTTVSQSSGKKASVKTQPVLAPAASVKKVQNGRHLGSSARTVSARPAPSAGATAALTETTTVVSTYSSVSQSGGVTTATTASSASVSVTSTTPVAAIPIPVRTKGYRPGAFEATKTLAELSDEPIHFKVGDNAVYPGHGVGRVNAIETKEIAGTQLTFYSIQIIESGMKIMVPQANVKSVGLRPIISKEEAYTVIDILRQTQVKIDNQTWNRRYREYMEKIKTGGVREIAEVLRDLFLLKVDKELSFGERKMLDTARSLLIKELILATSQEELLQEEHVKAILGLEG